jgi:hypothetical protein
VRVRTVLGPASTYGERLDRIAASRRTTAVLIAVGVLLRIVRWAADRSLWGDEGALAANIVEKPASALFKTLDYDQGAPTGFLLLEKAAVRLFGNGELALRAVPLAGGIVALLLFAALARRILRPAPAALALALFAILEPLVYFSSEVKQYSTDVTVSTLMLYAAVSIDWGKLRLLPLLAIGAAGFVAAWLSHPGLIVLGSLTVGLLALAAHHRDRAALRRLALNAGLWAGGALAAYVVNVHNTHGVASQALAAAGSGTSHTGPIRDLWHSYDAAFGFGRTTVALAAALTVAGIVALTRSRRDMSILLVLPVVATLLASEAGRYPFSDRFVLFLAPVFVIWVAAGADTLVRSTWRAAPVLAVAAVGLLLAYPAGVAAKRLLSPPGHEEVRTVLRYVSDNWRPGDALFVWYQSENPVRYYDDCTSCGVVSQRFVSDTLWPRTPPSEPVSNALATHPPSLFVGVSSHDLDTYATELAPLRGRRRAWILFSSTWDDDFAKLTLSCMGRQLDEVRAQRAVAYLYDLGVPGFRPPSSCPAPRS